MNIIYKYPKTGLVFQVNSNSLCYIKVIAGIRLCRLNDLIGYIFDYKNFVVLPPSIRGKNPSIYRENLHIRQVHRVACAGEIGF